MEVAEIISHHIDKIQNIIIVEFKLFGDDDDIVREDFIEYSFFEEFGFDNNNTDLDFLTEEDEWVDDEVDYITNEESLISFLNEYYVVYPKKLPKTQYK
jgi:hypothetical protein